METLRQLWRDETAAIASTDLALICTILVIGAIVGLTSLRDQVVQEFGDAAAAVGALNQSYSYSGTTIMTADGDFTVAGSAFVDATDDCDTGESGTGDVSGEPAACISVSVPASHEG